jgi:hypothetical protein
MITKTFRHVTDLEIAETPLKHGSAKLPIYCKMVVTKSPAKAEKAPTEHITS